MEEGVSWDVGIRRFRSASVVCGLGMVVAGVGLGACVVGDGFQALHWNMLSWSEFGRCTGVLRVLRRMWVLRGVSGGCMWSAARMGIVGYVDWESLCGVLALCWRDFFRCVLG